MRGNFTARTVAGILEATEYALVAEEMARLDGLLQRINPCAKVIGLLALIVAGSLSRRLWVIAGIFVIALSLALLSRVPVGVLAKRGWITSLLFTGMIGLPALFITPGPAFFSLPPLGLTVTKPGIVSVSFLITRVLTAVTLSLLLVLTTPWARVLKALRILGLPAVIVVSLGMTYRYIFLLLQTAREMLESRQSRTVGELPGSEHRRMAAASVGVLLGKSLQMSGEVYLAMQSRGFRGEVDTLDEFKMAPRDWLAMTVMVAIAVVAFLLGR